MRIWILSKHPASDYENARLLEECVKAEVQAAILHPEKFDLVMGTGGSATVLYEGEPLHSPDAVLVRTGSGSGHQCLTMLRALEAKGVPVTNSSDATELAKDKLRSGQVLSHAGIPTPRTMPVSTKTSGKRIADQIGFPCVLKLVTGSYGKGVHLIRSEAEFESLMPFLDAAHVREVMIAQEFVDSRVGEDLRVWVVGGRVIGAMQRFGNGGDFRANISNGGTGAPFETDPKMEAIAVRAAHAIGLDIAGIDLLFHEDGYLVCEANSSPGFAGFDTYCNANIARVIVTYIVNCLDPKQRESRDPALELAI